MCFGSHWTRVDRLQVQIEGMCKFSVMLPVRGSFLLVYSAKTFSAIYLIICFYMRCFIQANHRMHRYLKREGARRFSAIGFAIGFEMKPR
jgi:hypothetical protein